MDNLLWLESRNSIFVLLTRSSRVSCWWWSIRACYLEQPEASCMVKRREILVVVMTIYCKYCARSHREDKCIGR